MRKTFSARRLRYKLVWGAADVASRRISSIRGDLYRDRVDLVSDCADLSRDVRDNDTVRTQGYSLLCTPNPAARALTSSGRTRDALTTRSFYACIFSLIVDAGRHSSRGSRHNPTSIEVEDQPKGAAPRRDKMSAMRRGTGVSSRAHYSTIAEIFPGPPSARGGTDIPFSVPHRTRRQQFLSAHVSHGHPFDFALITRAAARDRKDDQRQLSSAILQCASCQQTSGKQDDGRYDRPDPYRKRKLGREFCYMRATTPRLQDDNTKFESTLYGFVQNYPRLLCRVALLRRRSQSGLQSWRH